MKYLLVFLFQIAIVSCWGQTSDDRWYSEGEEITMQIDKDVNSGKTKAEIEREKRDSIQKVDEKWRSYLSEKNAEIEEFFTQIKQIDSSKVTKEIIEEYKNQAGDMKERFDDKVNRNRWQHENEELDDLLALFNGTYKRIVSKLAQLETHLKPEKEPTNPLLILGIVLGSVMALIPIFTQIKSAITMKKMKKEQKQQAKKQQEEMEKQLLLMDENNIITLKE